MKKTEEEWKKILTKEQFHILREKGTEHPFTGALTDNKKKGKYYCAGCGNELFLSDYKFDSGCGWPSFTRHSKNESVSFNEDISQGMKRIEVTCKKCKGHLGHVFNDAPIDTGKRYCINSSALKFKE